MESLNAATDPESLQLLADSVRTTMTNSSVPRALSSMRRWPTSAGSTCSMKFPISQYL